MGPAWCSYLCYIGAWDNLAARAKKIPGLTCTLCGDCITRCKENALEYKFPGIKPTTARSVFIVTAASLHAIFLGAARL